MNEKLLENLIGELEEIEEETENGFAKTRATQKLRSRFREVAVGHRLLEPLCADLTIGNASGALGTARQMLEEADDKSPAPGI